MTEFTLDERLAADTVFITNWPLSRVLLMNDARYSWLVLVPRRADVSELYELAAADRAQLIEEIARASAVLKSASGGAKINVGALGNIVAQLHVHIVARLPQDAAWPGPVWGQGSAVPFELTRRDALVAQLRKSL
jgi:diadenosine tetraphosphate (Ap4A) HIT family hydrolase